ncbi:MAG: OmpA family protein [Myxococcales bacterium]|nr:OmpA family protein [Myxococcales bacterium]
MRHGWIVMVVLAVAGTAAAQDVERLRPRAGSGHLFNTAGAETVPAGRSAFGVWLSMAGDPLVRARGDEVVGSVVERLTVMTLAMEVGLSDAVELGVAMPVGHATGPEIGLLGGEEGWAAGDLRLGARWRVLGERGGDGFRLALGVEATLPTGDGTRGLGSGSVTVQPGVDAELALGPARVMAHVGYVYRDESDRVANLEIADEIAYGAGALVALGDSGWSLIGELQGAGPVEALRDSNKATPLEALLGARVAVGDGHALTLGAGRGVIDGYGAPAWRGVLAYAWQPKGEPAADCPACAACPACEACPAAPVCPSCEVADPDGDGIIGDFDACPDAAENRDGFEDADGCPDTRPDEPPPPPPAAPKAVRLSCDAIEFDENIQFETGRYVLEQSSLPVLDEIARTLAAHPEIRRIRLEGHTDDQGSTPFNARLSLQRVWVVREYLAERGIDKRRIAYQGFGETRPLVPNDSDEARYRNRRVDIKILEADARAGCP